MKALKAALAPVASLRLTIVLLLLAMLLVLAGTTAQREMGIQDVQRQIFHSVWVKIYFHYFQPTPPTPPGHVPSEGYIPGYFYMPGGYALMAAMLINLLAAHLLRFKLRWKRAGIIMIHTGLVLLLMGEWLTSFYAVESQMQVDVGGSASYSQDIRFAELAVVDPSPRNHDNVTVIPSSRLAGAVGRAPIRSSFLPFDVRVDRWYENSTIRGPRENGSDVDRLANAGDLKSFGITSVAKVSGASAGSGVDQPSAFITLSRDGVPLGTYLVTLFARPDQRIEVDGSTYLIGLRWTRYYKPYTVHLKKFTHDIYPGTEIPRDFASTIRLVDSDRHVDREARIWMNHPLSYGFETLYQQSFLPGDRTSILQIVYNPSWWMPYVACVIGALGLIVHFGITLTAFLRRKLSPAEGTVGAVTQGRRSKNAPPNRYSLSPASIWKARIIPITAVALGLIFVISPLVSTVPTMPYDLEAFGQLPISIEGRVQPLDSVARNMLGIINNGHTHYRDAGGQKQPAIQWLLNVMTRSRTWNEEKVIRIDHPQVKDLFGLKTDEKYFSWKDLDPDSPEVAQKLFRQVQLAEKVRPDEQDSFQHQIIELDQHLNIFRRFIQVDVIAYQTELLGKPEGRAVLNNLKLLNPEGQLLLTAPLTPGQKWEPISSAIDHPADMPESAAMFLKIARDYADGNAHEFNNDVAAYQSRLAGLPEMGKVETEVLFNRFGAFDLCLFLYFCIFLIALFSWLLWQKPLWQSGIGVMSLALLVHTIGVVLRIYISGRPPVTNLYSAAVFIGWGIAAFALAMELIYRNGIGLVAGSIAGFLSLLVAEGFAAGEGDTMRQLQAVLDTNIWLATHVVCVTLGYMASVFGGFLGIIFILRGLIDRSFKGEKSKDNSRMIYGITCFAMLFSFVGTILGGIWADQSWGRFWGWDPKENGAVLVVLWNALILHARWSGIVQERGVAMLAVLGNIVVGWSFVGTNLLGIGLHSYGFMSGAQLAIVIWSLANLTLAASAIFVRVRVHERAGSSPPAFANATA